MFLKAIKIDSFQFLFYPTFKKISLIFNKKKKLKYIHALKNI